MTDEVDASLNFRHDGADNEGASPLITPQNRAKHKKTKKGGVVGRIFPSFIIPVSYTHLEDTMDNIRRRLTDSVEMEIAVSYTHLDVYKRQDVTTSLSCYFPS